MAALAQTISVIDKSGKIVSTSKHLLGVFKEARSAYRERKTEIKAERRAKRAEKQAIEAQQALAAFTLEESRSVTSRRSRARSVTRHSEHESRHRHPRNGSHRYEQDLASSATRGISRRHTSHDIAVAPTRPLHHGNRSNSAPHVDMDLAYGEYHAPSLERASLEEEEDLKGLVGKVKMALDEADCAHHSVNAIVSHLQKHPDAMAAVALTLAEISNLVAKMAPGALAALKGSAPAVFALLASPQFLIAAGVGIGVTVVMFGGYKIVKRIQEAKSNAGGDGDNVEEMVELNSRISHIENWRRGVADSGAMSVGTSVDGEFITPTAAAMSGIHLPLRVNELRGEGGGSRRAPSESSSRRSRSSRTSRSSRRSKASSEKTGKESKKKKDSKDKKKPKHPSPLRLLFKSS